MPKSLVNALGPRRTLGVLLPLLAGAVVLLFLSGPGPSGGAAWAEEDEIEISLNEKFTIEDLLSSVGKTGQTIVWDPNDKSIRGKEIIGSVPLRGPKNELFAVVRALLTFFDLVMVPVGPEGYQVYLVMDVRQTTQILKLKPKYVELTDENVSAFESQDGMFITATIKVQNMLDLRDARNALQRIVTGQNIGSVQEVPAARAFVVTDFAPNVVSIYRLLKEMDVQPKGKEVTSEFIPLINATADEIEPILTDLFTGKERITQVPRPQGPQGQAGGDLIEEIEPRIISDARTNQIIVYATLEDIEQIKAVIAKLDVNIQFVNERVHVIRLKNLKADETAEVLRSLIDSTTLFGTGTGTTSTGTGAGGRVGRVPGAQPGTAVTEAAQEEQKPAVVADVASNSLIIAATPRQMESIKRIIDTIDTKKPQVLIEAALIELTLDDSFKLAVELGLADDKALVTGQGVSGGAFSTFGLNTFVDKDGDTFFTDRIPNFIDQGGSAPTGLVGGIFAMGQVPLIFNVLQSVTQSRILQLPSVTVADNQEAVIEAKDRQAVTTTSTTGTGIQTGGFQDFEEAGTTLTISPHIADNFYLLLDIRLEVSAFVGESRVVGGALVPSDQITRTLHTQVTIPDRHTVVLGGLLGNSQRSTVDAVPVLSDIPVLGHLFKSTATRDRQTSLFLFVTPTIMSEPGGFDVLDRESCRRKQKADELIGYTEIFNSNFVGCDLQDPATGCIRGSGSASDRLDRLGALEATRFAGVSLERLEAERAARRKALERGAPPSPAPVRPGGSPSSTR